MRIVLDEGRLITLAASGDAAEAVIDTGDPESSEAYSISRGAASALAMHLGQRVRVVVEVGDDTEASLDEASRAALDRALRTLAKGGDVDLAALDREAGACSADTVAMIAARLRDARPTRDGEALVDEVVVERERGRAACDRLRREIDRLTAGTPAPDPATWCKRADVVALLEWRSNAAGMRGETSARDALRRACTVVRNGRERQDGDERASGVEGAEHVDRVRGPDGAGEVDR